MLFLRGFILKPAERAFILQKKGTRDFQNRSPFERLAYFYVTMLRQRKRWVQNVLITENRVLPVSTLFFSKFCFILFQSHGITFLKLHFDQKALKSLVLVFVFDFLAQNLSRTGVVPYFAFMLINWKID